MGDYFFGYMDTNEKVVDYFNQRLFHLKYNILTY